MDKNQHLRNLSENTLDIFQQITSKAQDALQGVQGSTNALVAGNSMTGNLARSNLEKINRTQGEAYRASLAEPAISRVVAADEDGIEKTYFICRSAPMTLDTPELLASYYSPMGRLASLPPGDEATLSIGGKAKQFLIVEKLGLHPQKKEGDWDSSPSVFEHEKLGTFTIESMLKLLGLADISSEADELEALLADDGGSGVTEGIAHQIRSAISLRDQPILDKFQDEIFRLPMDSKLIILGPPGTGKTTTLIKRLGQKLDKVNLEEAERFIAVDDPRGLPHEQSWLMFTPTDLLKHYVKEAFAREQVPASNERIQTWDAHRKYLSRNVLGVLQSSTSKNGFIHKESLSNLKLAVEADPRAFYEAFSDFHNNRMLVQLKAGVRLLKSVEKDREELLIANLSKTVDNMSASSLVRGYGALIALEPEIVPRIKSLKSETDTLIRKSLNREFNKNKRFLHQLADFLSTQVVDDELDDDEQFDDEMVEEEQGASGTDVQRAAAEYIRAIRALARSNYLKRSVPKNRKAALIRGWLGDRMPVEDDFHTIGLNIVIQNGLRRFVRPMRRYVTRVPASYRAFRKSSFKEGDYFSSVPEINKHISTIELDAIVLLTLRSARELLAQSFVARIIDDSSMDWLSRIVSQFRNQILVDETTDFSALQLGAMVALTKLKNQSFFACGDFNQRITSEGVRSIDQVEWACHAVIEKTITTVYRQSEKLNEFAQVLTKQMGGDTSALGQLPDNHNHPGLSPVLAEGLDNPDDIACWLFERIREVESSVRQMPTVAVLVNSEAEVKPMAESLGAYLEDINLRAVPCFEGQALGEGTDVRVFDVQHIKGLEFEAVFFVGIDELSNNLPELFDKYLYVGATRAATYLGVSCKDVLPDKLAGIKSEFIEQWQ